MSYIFEALQRAEAERSGGSLPKNADSVADLLQKVEQEIDRKQSLSELPLPAKRESAGSRDLCRPRKCSCRRLPADARLVCLTDQGSLAAEKFRVLGLKLRHLRERRKLKRIVITSSIPEEGKSLIAANLALNQSRSKVLNTVLIDGDLRRPELGTPFRLQSQTCPDSARFFVESASCLKLCTSSRAPDSGSFLRGDSREPNRGHAGRPVYSSCWNSWKRSSIGLSSTLLPSFLWRTRRSG